jgi:hypothetical protein
MASLWLRTTNIGTLGLALTLASPSIAQSGSDAAQSGAVIYWNAAQCTGGYRPDVYSVHCEPGPAAVILDFKAKAQFSCMDSAPADIRWAIPADAKPGPPIPPSEINWRAECWKTPLRFDAGANTQILSPQFSQTPPPNNYMTMNVVVLYDAGAPTIKICLVPLFPGFAVEPACADAEIRS